VGTMRTTQGHTDLYHAANRDTLRRPTPHLIEHAESSPSRFPAWHSSRSAPTTFLRPRHGNQENGVDGLARCFIRHYSLGDEPSFARITTTCRRCCGSRYQHDPPALWHRREPAAGNRTAGNRNATLAVQPRLTKTARIPDTGNRLLPGTATHY